VLDQLLAFERAQVRLGISDVDSEQHAHRIVSWLPVSSSSRDRTPQRPLR
jgi:hypothetical protein